MGENLWSHRRSRVYRESFCIRECSVSALNLSTITGYGCTREYIFTSSYKISHRGAYHISFYIGSDVYLKRIISILVRIAIK